MQSKRSMLPAELQSESWGWNLTPWSFPLQSGPPQTTLIPCTRQTQQIWEVRRILPSSPTPIHCIQVPGHRASLSGPPLLDGHVTSRGRKPSWAGTHLSAARLPFQDQASPEVVRPRRSSYLGHSSCSRAKHNLAKRRAGASEELTLHLQVLPAVDPGLEHREQGGPNLWPAAVHHHETACPQAHSNPHHKLGVSPDGQGPPELGAWILGVPLPPFVVHPVGTGEVGHSMINWSLPAR